MNPEIESYRTLLTSPGAPRPDAVAPRLEEPRRSNLCATLSLLHLQGQQSRSDLVAQLGLSRSTIGSLINELADAGLVEEAGVDRLPSPGRPSLVVRLVPAGHVALAAEVGPGHIGVATVAMGGRVLSTSRRALRRPDNDMPELLAAIARIVEEQLDQLPDATRIIGLGIAVAGLVSADGILAHAPNLGWTRTDVRAELAALLPDLGPATVANESTLAAVGEYLRGSLRGVANGVVVIGDIGVGGSAIVNGRLLAGSDAMAGEVGHMKVEMDGRRCRCGGLGCWETRVGLEAVQRHTGTTDLVPAGDVVEAILRLAEVDDPAVLAGLDETGRWLGWGLASLVNIFNPTRIVVGGRLGTLLPQLLAGVEEELSVSALAAMRADLEVTAPSLGKDAALIGAAEHVFWNAINDLDRLVEPPAVTASPAGMKE